MSSLNGLRARCSSFLESNLYRDVRPLSIMAHPRIQLSRATATCGISTSNARIGGVERAESRSSLTATSVSNKNGPSGISHKTGKEKGTTINSMIYLSEYYDKLSLSAFVAACEVPQNVKLGRTSESVNKNYLSLSWTPVKAFVAAECTHKLLPMIGSVCSSLCHWMEGFQKDFMPVICSRLVDKLADLEHDQLFSLLTAIPPDLPCKEDFCNKAGEVLLPKAHRLSPEEMLTCLGSLHAGTHKTTLQLLKICLDGVMKEDFAQFPILLLFRCGDILSCRELALGEFAKKLINSLAQRNDLVKFPRQTFTVCLHMVGNGFTIPDHLVDRLYHTMPQRFEHQWSLNDLCRVIAVFSAVPTSKERCRAEQNLIEVLSLRLDDVPQSSLMPLLRSACKGIVQAEVRSKVLVAVSRRVPPNETSADDILLATAAARRDCADSAYEVVLEWLLAALESKDTCLQMDLFPPMVAACHQISPRYLRRTTMARVRDMVYSWTEFICLQPTVSFSLPVLEAFAELMRKVRLRPQISHVRSLFTPFMMHASPADTVRCLRCIHHSFGEPFEEMVVSGIAAMAAHDLVKLSNSDLMWMVEFFENKASADFSQLTALQQTVAARVANRQLYPAELCQLGGMQKLTTAGEETILQAIGSVRHSLESLTETDLTGLLRMALNVTNPDKQLIVEIRAVLSDIFEGSAVRSLHSLLVSRSSDTAVICPLLEKIMSQIPKARDLEQYAQVLPALYKANILHLGRPLAYELALELEKRFGDAAVSDYPPNLISMLYCISMVVPVPVSLLVRFDPSMIMYGMPLQDVVNLVHAFASTGNVTKKLGVFLAMRLARDLNFLSATAIIPLIRSLTTLACFGHEALLRKLEPRISSALYMAKFLKHNRYHSPEFLHKVRHELQEYLPTTKTTWSHIMFYLLTHCAQVPYHQSDWHAVVRLGMVPFLLKPLEQICACCAEWVHICQTGRLALSNDGRAWLGVIFIPSLMYTDHTKKELHPECAEIVMLLDAIGCLDGGESSVSAPTLQELSERHLTSVSQSFADNNGSAWYSLKGHRSLHSATVDWLEKVASSDEMLSTAAIKVTTASNCAATNNSQNSPTAEVPAQECDSVRNHHSGHLAGEGAGIPAQRSVSAVKSSCAHRWPLAAASRIDDASVDAASHDSQEAGHPAVTPTPLLSPSDSVSQRPSPKCIHGPVVDKGCGVLIDAALALDSQGDLLPFPSPKSVQSNGLLPWGPPNWPQGTSKRIALIVLRPEHFVQFSDEMLLDVRAKLLLLEALGWVVHTLHSAALFSDHADRHIKSLFSKIKLMHGHLL